MLADPVARRVVDEYLGLGLVRASGMYSCSIRIQVLSITICIHGEVSHEPEQEQLLFEAPVKTRVARMSGTTAEPRNGLERFGREVGAVPRSRAPYREG